MRFLPIVTQIFLWAAIFSAIENTAEHRAATSEPARIAGYRYEDFVAYYLLTMISRAFSSMPGLASGVARQIRDGEIKKYLIQPVDMIGFLLLGRIAHKLVYYGVALAPFALVFYLCRGFFPGWPAPEVMAAYVASLVMAFLLGFFMEAALGLVGFWFLEVSSLLFVYMLFNFFLSGHMFPIDMLPSPLDTIVRLVPLQYLAYFPAAVFLGKIEGSDLAIGLASQAAWVAAFILLSRWLFNRGTKRYSAYGG
ncbi:MAG: ABC transporter permease [Planctomycetota bacterium]|nr:MAG: ABC transporter permease [Planctomycetota bacterium]